MKIDIDKLLRLPPDGSRPVLVRFNLRTVIAAALRDVRAIVAATGAYIECQDEFPVVLAHRLLLGQAFTNVLSNALIHRRPHRLPVVRIAASSTPHIVAISFTDNGIGIAAHELERIFTPRRHVRGASVRLTAGLAIVRRAVELQGGTVAVTSKLGCGSTFTLRLASSV